MQERGGRTNLQCQQQKKDGKLFFFAFFTSFPFCTRAHNVRSYKTPKKKGDTCLERLRETGIFFRHFIYNTTFPLPPPSPRQKVGPFSGPIHPPAHSSVPLGSLSPTAKLWGSPRLLLLPPLGFGGGIESKEVISSSSPGLTPHRKRKISFVDWRRRRGDLNTHCVGSTSDLEIASTQIPHRRKSRPSFPAEKKGTVAFQGPFLRLAFLLTQISF